MRVRKYDKRGVLLRECEREFLQAIGTYGGAKLLTLGIIRPETAAVRLRVWLARRNAQLAALKFRVEADGVYGYLLGTPVTETITIRYTHAVSVEQSDYAKEVLGELLQETNISPAPSVSSKTLEIIRLQAELESLPENTPNFIRNSIELRIKDLQGGV